MAINNLFSVVEELQRSTRVELRLSVSEDKVTVMETVNLTLTFRRGVFDASLFSSMRYLIGWKNDIRTRNWVVAQQITDTHNNLLIRKPGKWEVQVEAVLAADGTTIRSDRKQIEVRYPNVTDIQADATVTSAMNATWMHTKAAASAAGRQEFGFWIYYDTGGAGSFLCGPEIPGAQVPGCAGTNGSVRLGRATLENRAMSPFIPGVYIVGGFHTHTPLTFCPTRNPVTRNPVGPSPSDTSWASSQKMPGLVYDYTGVYDANLNGYGIVSGHIINALDQIYTFGPNRKSTPNNIAE